MKTLVGYFAIFGILSSYLVSGKTFNFFEPDDSLGKMEYHDHRGLKVYFFTPLHNSGVDKVVVGNQGIWTARSGQTLTKLVGFFRCMGFGLSHVSYFNQEGENKELLLGYSHGDDNLVEFDRKRFYDKLLDYTVSSEPFNKDVPGHLVLYQLEQLLKEREESEKKSKAEKVAEVVHEAAEKKSEVPVTEEAHTEL
ncbi:conserved hypothetical protein [Theileria orientalis strain Shintoku]|uniref:Uncharacterized protein n=2 Tax=Theileria orientalis TaxID=68886 RepID=J4C8V3_THEOR|nr:conserved hypothetical protein [Theileria orientalis strain Shintoku]PVC50410.1 hypothetical protein MACL_00002285 [Theileria orientalis]BAI48740.1 microneme-rhoptry related protein [Theileria orientalis]BAM41438.1 conserved hypothetical protein [Theileria orientalis strain Shintoku]|eukprot:XP_009691739.1 conserved hypothetical protein [Theileria orientalis strain Shintoku]